MLKLSKASSYFSRLPKKQCHLRQKENISKHLSLSLSFSMLMA